MTAGDGTLDAAVAAVSSALASSYDGGCGTTSLRNRNDPRLQARTAVLALLILGWSPPVAAVPVHQQED